jgi:hypothetical protein
LSAKEERPRSVTLYRRSPSIGYLKATCLAEALDLLNEARQVLCPAYAGGTEVISKPNEVVKPSAERG